MTGGKVCEKCDFKCYAIRYRKIVDGMGWSENIELTKKSVIALNIVVQLTVSLTVNSLIIVVHKIDQNFRLN